VPRDHTGVMTHQHWPLFDLRVRTPRLELRPPDESAMFALVALADRGIHPPDYMPFLRAWTREPDGIRQRHSLQYFWRCWSLWEADAWELPLGVWVGGELAGVQSIMANAFPDGRTFETGSWLQADHQGHGLGKEMRAAVLHLGFAGLGAVRATTGAFHDNTRSLAVTAALGYEPNGDQIKVRDGRPERCLEFKMERADWERRRRPDITIEGLAPCRVLFGLDDQSG
jgi:RimJ/RimL family protein N-acetyltransferase